jgi:hypothetical protein
MTGNWNQNTLMVSPQLAWVKLNRYGEISGDTPEAIRAKRKKGVWLDGLQCKVGPDGTMLD